MTLSSKQIQELLNIIDKNQAIAITKDLGPDFLTESDHDVLKEAGVNWKKLYDPAIDGVYTQFHLGMLAESLGQTYADGLTYDQLKEYISKGRYIPLTIREEAAINVIKRQKFNDLKKLGGRIFTDVNQILINNSLKEQQNFMRKEMAEGVGDKQTVTEIAHHMAELTGDWGRDFERIVACNNHLALEEGKAAMMERDADGEDPMVYKTPFDGACESCIHLFLTKGVGSQPRLFKLSQLRANGTNIGRKKSEWKAVLGFVHPYCRCPLHQLLPGWIWDPKKKRFVSPSETKYIIKRPKIRVWIGGEEKMV